MDNNRTVKQSRNRVHIQSTLIHEKLHESSSDSISLKIRIQMVNDDRVLHVVGILQKKLEELSRSHRYKQGMFCSDGDVQNVHYAVSLALCTEHLDCPQITHSLFILTTHRLQQHRSN